jgi:two-component system chemotaxis sensor kinase CheA
MMDEHLDLFREEAYELLAELETSLLELEETPDDAAIIGRVFRALHTIKGSGSMVGFDEIATFTHQVETAFDLVRDGKLTVTKELVGVTLLAKDWIRATLDTSVGGGPGDTQKEQAILTSLSELVLAATPVRQPAGAPPDQPSDPLTYSIYFRPASNIFINGTNPLCLLDELAQLGDCQVAAHSEAIPPLAEIDPEACYTYWDITLTTRQGLDAIKDVFIFVEDDCELTIEVTDTAPYTGGKIDQPHIEEKRKAAPSLNRDGAAQPKQQAAPSASSIRVPAEKLDWLVNLVGELVTVQASLSQTVASQNITGLTSIVEEIERLSGELRDVTLNIRMIPIGTTFSQFKRLVHDLSHKLGKEVKMITEGAETGLDKTVIERLNDPLVHLIRNSIDHGIESPEVRQAAGKPRQGTIHLSAVHAGANVLIQVKDDGAGLDVDAIRARAVEKGLVEAEAELSEAELFALIFAPGFSTAGQVTDVSGRGVGLDVVRGAITAMQGSIDIASQPGWGTTITLKLPLTLAIIDGLLVNVGQENFVLPLLAVEECVELTSEDVAQAHGRHLADVRGEVVPYIRLRDQFKINGQPPAIEQIVITQVENRRIGLVVDQVIGEHQTVIKTLSRAYRKVEEIAGATILGNGTVALILDISKLVQAADSVERAALEKALCRSEQF